MENKRGNGIFLSLIGVATLVVAIIGATFAYFSATAQSDPNAITAQSTVLKLGLKEIPNLKSNMIPSEEDIVEFAAFDADWIAGEKDYGDGVTAQGQCIDQNGNEICSVYEFYIGNPSETTNMNIEGELIITTNEFTNLHYAIYDEAGEIVMTSIVDKDEPEANVATALPSTGSVPLTALAQQLLANPDVAQNEEGTGVNPDFDEDDPSTYKPLVSPEEAAEGALTNVRHYTLVIWIHEMEKDQTGEDTNTDESGNVIGSMFAAGIKFTTAGADGDALAGVTGVIAVAG